MLTAILAVLIASTPVFAQDAVPLGEVIEAESLRAVNAAEDTEYAEEASGGEYVYLPEGQMEPEKPVSYIEVPIENMKGLYEIRVRCMSPGGGSDSLRYGIEGRGQWPQKGLGHEPVEWRWHTIELYHWADGITTVLIGARERSRIDQIEVIKMDSGAAAPHQRRVHRPEPNQAHRPQVNPPTFRWPLQSEAETYRVQVAADPHFSEMLVDQTVEGNTFFRPLNPLPPGTIWWHWRADSFAEGAWGNPQEFDLPGDLERWPLPDWEDSFERIPPDHPRVFTTPEHLQKMKEWAQTPEGQEALDVWRDRLKSELGKTLPLEQGTEKGEDLTREERVMRRVTFKGEAGRTAGQMGNMALLYRLTGEEKWAEEVRRRALLIADLDPRGYASHEVSDFGNGRLVEGLAYSYDYMQDYLTDQELAKIKSALKERLQITRGYFKNLEQKVHAPHAWQHTFYNFMEGCLALCGDDEEATDWFHWCVKATVALYPWFGGADGGSAEMANYFSGTNLPSSMHMRDLIYRASGIDLLNNPWYHNSVYYTIYSQPPNHNRSMFGDHGGGPESGPPGSNRYVTTRYRATLFDDAFAAAYARGYEGNPLLRVSLREAYDWLAKPVPEPKSLSLLPDARAFRDIGVVYMHTAMERPQDNIFFEFKSGPYGSFGHSHNDQNTFNLMAFNEPLLIDTGYYHSYGDAHHAGWTMRTKAHNGILVDNTGQPNSELSAFGRVIDFEQGDEFMYCAGEASTAYNEVELDRFTRHCLCIKPDIFLIYDQLKAPDPHTYQFLLHAEKEMDIDHLTQTVDVTGEVGKCRATILQPSDLSISQTDVFDPPAKHWRPDKSWAMPNQWHLTAETTGASKEVRFLTVIEVRGADEAYAKDVHRVEGDKWLGVSIGRGDSTVVAAFSKEIPPLDGPPPAVSIELPGLQMNAFAGAAEIVDGEAARVITIAGDEAAVQ